MIKLPEGMGDAIDHGQPVEGANGFDFYATRMVVPQQERR